MYIKTRHILSPNVTEEKLIKPDTVYRVLNLVNGTSQVDVDTKSAYYLSPEYYTVVNFKDYMKLCT